MTGEKENAEPCEREKAPIELEEGLRDADVTVEVRDYCGRREFLPVDTDMIEQEGGRSYLPRAIRQLDKARKAAIVTLPVEADSGAHGSQVKLSDLKDSSETLV